MERRLEILADGSARAVGVVVSNEQHCVVDAQCWLVLAVDGVRARVVYVEGEAVPTVNEAAAEQGFAAQPGDLVEVYGAYGGSAASPLISTCQKTEFYIRALDVAPPASRP